MPDLALWDLVAPYWLLGNAAGNAHAAFAALAVDEYEQATDGIDTVIRGRARFYGEVDAFFDPANMTFGVSAANTEGHPKDDPTDRDPWIDLRDTTVDFQLVAPRRGSPVIASGHGPIDNPAAGDPFAPTDAVLDALDTLPIDLPISDYPSTDFRIDLVFTTAVLRPPLLKPARMRADGLLEPDPDKTAVAFTLPRIKVAITQDAGTANAPVFTLESVGAQGLDDPGDIGVAQFVTMDPPYAFIDWGRTVGFGFRSAILDLSDQSTPTEVLDQFGFDPSWTGVYLPEIRLFLAPQGVEGLAVNAGARNLLIGIGQHSGVTGDFELDVINQGGGPLALSARFSTPAGHTIYPTSTGDDTAKVELPALTTMIVDVGGRRPPYTVEISLDGGTTFQTERMIAVDMGSGADSTRTIVIRATTPDDPIPGELTITARRADTSGGSGTTPPPPSAPDAKVTASATTRNGVAVDTPDLVIDSQTTSTVTLRLSDRSVATWTVNGVPVPGGPTVTTSVELTPGQSKQIQASVAGASTTAPVYFHFDQPDQQTDAQLAELAVVGDLTRTAQSVNDPDSTAWTGGSPVLTSQPGQTPTLYSPYAEALATLGQSDSVTVVGHASFEANGAGPTYNLDLSRRRAKVAAALYGVALDSAVTVTFDPRGYSEAQPAQAAGDPRSRWWRAELATPINLPGTVTIGTVERDPVDTPPPVPVVTDPVPAEPERPDFFRSIGAKVRIIRNDFIAVEIHGEIDIDTATEAAMRGQVDPAEMPTFSGLGHQNPADGIVKYRGVFTLDPGSDEWALTVLFGADPADVDGLAMTGRLPGQPAQADSIGRDLLGLYALFMPLLSELSPEKPASAELEDLVIAGVAAGVPAGLAATGWFTVQRVVWFGAEVAVRQRDGGWTTAILLDVETAISADIALGGQSLITIDPDIPLVARYKAIGFRFGVDVNGEPIFHPAFDSSKGYSLDLSRPGSLTVAEPLGRLLMVLGARISRTNPMFLEVELGASVDLGVVSLDRAGVRIIFDDPVSVELTALGVGVDVPGVIAGSGYLAFDENGFRGRVDVTLTPLRLRIAARLRIEHITQGDREATGVAIALEVEFPVGIPLWSSGLGIYGFIGLFAMHFTRNEAPDAASTTKALSWLKRADGDPTKIEEPSLWKADIDHWAFGIGTIIGTMGSSVVFNMKGIVLLELPGPRLLLMMKASVLKVMPALEGDAEGQILAVVDIDVARETLTIGLSMDFGIEPLIRIRIPVEAFFDGKDAENWHLYLGQYSDQIRAEVLSVFSGSGYLMLKGDGNRTPIPFHPDLPAPDGFTISTGVHVSMIWGVKPAGLYAELSAGFDAIVGFSPLLVAGTMYVRGDLRLFIVWLSAHAKLNVRLGELPGSEPPDTGYRIDGEVCGKISLFFFDIEGCVDFVLEDDEPPKTVIEPLLEGVSLLARSPALVHGTATDEAVDGALGEAVASDTEPNWNLPADPADDNPTQAAVRAASNVPINVVPAVMFGAPPLASGVTFKGGGLGGSSGGRTIVRSTDKITYTLHAVDLIGPIKPGNTPATWWTLRPPIEANESAQLGLLTWTPSATPKALQRSDVLDRWITDRWSTVCDDAAPPTSVMWTFRFEPIGPSASGWELDGEPWPDPPGTVRSSPPDTRLSVRDGWRCGDPLADDYRGIGPATVVGAMVKCPDGDEGHPVEPVGGLIGRGGARVGRGPAGALVAGTKQTSRLVESSLSLSETLNRLRSGLDVPRASLGEVLAPNKATNEPGELVDCESRVLASPRFDTLEPPADPELADDIKLRWEETGFTPLDLHDAVILSAECFDTVRLMLFVPERLLRAEEVIVRARNGDTVIDEHVVTSADVATLATLPFPWIDPAGPWVDDVIMLIQHLTVLGQLDFRHRLVVVEMAPGDATDIVIGTRTGGFDTMLPTAPFHVAAIEALSCSEIVRHDSDSQTVADNHSVLEAALSAESANVALLEPDTAYRVTVNWSAEAFDAENTKTERAPATDTFWFRTAADSPERLDPWILATTPYDNERHVFGGEPLQLTFATQDIIDLFDAYEERLEVRLNAASSRHPDPEPETGLEHPFPLDWSTTVPIAASVLSPWEDTVAGQVDPDCVEIDGERVRHSQTSILLPLDPATDYLLDIFKVAKNAPDGTVGQRILRRGFSTSRFPAFSDYCQFLIGTRTGHRAVPNGLAQSIRTRFATEQPRGAELDQAMAGGPGQAGVEPMPVPKQPRVVVWWEQPGATPQPVAVMVDSVEPLWRERERPRLEPVDGTDLKIWRIGRDPWVEPVAGTGLSNLIDHIVMAPGGQRALILLKPNSRGKRLTVDLLRHTFTEAHLDGPAAVDERHLIVDVTLLHAPWEEV